MLHFVAIVKCEQIIFTTVFKHHPRKVLVSLLKKPFFFFGVTYPLSRQEEAAVRYTKFLACY